MSSSRVAMRACVGAPSSSAVLRWSAQFLVSLFASLAVSAAVTAAELKITEEIVGPPYEMGTVYTVSPKGLHLATASAKGSRFVVTIDGVEGEKYDAILNAAVGVEVQRYDSGFIMWQQAKWQGPVAFSPDGQRYAYAARLGKEVIVILDGKEIFRGPFSTVVVPVSILSFTPDSKHVFFYTQTSDTMQSFRLVMDGKPVTPPFEGTPYPFFSADGSRWGVVGAKPRAPGERFLVIDGKDAGYAGVRPQFTLDGKRVVSTLGDQPPQSLLVDGKAIMTAQFIDKFVISSRGDIAAIASGTDGKKKLFLNGKAVAGGEDAWDVVFSADGKHWAASCVASPNSWVVLDGKKQADYNQVEGLVFTADSAKCVYVATAGVKKFVVINGEEDAGNNLVHVRPILSKTGGHVAYSAGEMMGKLQVHYDGKILPQSYNNFSLTLSPDGSRYAYYGAIDALGTTLVVDGEPKGTGAAFGGGIWFSPDSKHVVTIAAPPKGYPSIFIDGSFIPLAKGVQYGEPLGFTPDSQHLVMRATDVGPDGSPAMSFYVDGQRAAQFTSRGIGWVGGERPQLYEARADGSVAFIGPSSAENNGFGPMKRFTAVPAAGTSVVTWISDVEAARAKDLADAAEAKAKAEATALAAKEKAKADYDAAVAQKKADREAAAAAKAQARQDAIDARAKAKADAAAKKVK